MVPNKRCVKVQVLSPTDNLSGETKGWPDYLGHSVLRAELLVIQFSLNPMLSSKGGGGKKARIKVSGRILIQRIQQIRAVHKNLLRITSVCSRIIQLDPIALS